MNYLNLLKEQFQKEKGKGGFKKKPSPTFAYELVHGKPVPGGWRSGRYPLPHKTKNWKGVQVDFDLKNKWLDDLNSILNVEIRGSCAGHSEDWVSYIAFRINPSLEKDKTFLNKITQTLNKDKYTKCGWDIGTQNRPRFVCATPLLPNKERAKWEKWWSTLADRIDQAVNN